MLLCRHYERRTGAWQSHSIKTRLPRHFIPRNDTLLNAFRVKHPAHRHGILQHFRNH
jgi:hypothetical protein